MLYNSTDALIFRALMHMSSAYGLYTKTNNNALQKQTKTILFQQISSNIVQIFLGNDIHVDPAIQN